MLIQFEERLDLPAEHVYAYFRSPRDWPRLYGSFGEVEDRGDGWYAVPLRGFPFPLVARVTQDEPNRSVSWSFRGFWHGAGQVSFEPTERGVVIRGYERISVRPAGFASPLLERLFLERRFRRVWESGWRRLRRQAQSGAGHVSLHEACYQGRVDVVTQLLASGADPNEPADPTMREWVASAGSRLRPLNCVAIAWTMTENHVEIARLLIESGAVVDDSVLDDHTNEMVGGPADSALRSILETQSRGTSVK